MTMERRSEDRLAKINFDKWGKRFVTALAVLGALETAFMLLAGRIQWPRDTIAAIAARVSTIETQLPTIQAQVAEQKVRTDSSLALGKTNLKLICVVISHTNPRGAVLPPECP